MKCDYCDNESQETILYYGDSKSIKISHQASGNNLYQKTEYDVTLKGTVSVSVCDICFSKMSNDTKKYIIQFPRDLTIIAIIATIVIGVVITLLLNGIKGSFLGLIITGIITLIVGKFTNFISSLIFEKKYYKKWTARYDNVNEKYNVYYYLAQNKLKKLSGIYYDIFSQEEIKKMNLKNIP